MHLLLQSPLSSKQVIDYFYSNQIITMGRNQYKAQVSGNNIKLSQNRSLKYGSIKSGWMNNFKCVVSSKDRGSEIDIVSEHGEMYSISLAEIGFVLAVAIIFAIVSSVYAILVMIVLMLPIILYFIHSRSKIEYKAFEYDITSNQELKAQVISRK